MPGFWLKFVKHGLFRCCAINETVTVWHYFGQRCPTYFFALAKCAAAVQHALTDCEPAPESEMHPEMIPPLAWIMIAAAFAALIGIVAFNRAAPGRHRRKRELVRRQRTAEQGRLWAWDQLKRKSSRQRRLEFRSDEDADTNG